MFIRLDFDVWELRKGLNEIYGYDLVLEFKIIIVMFYVCRRFDDFFMIVRVFEVVYDKGVGSNEIYNYILGEIKFIMEELGFFIFEEFGLVK